MWLTAAAVTVGPSVGAQTRGLGGCSWPSPAGPAPLPPPLQQAVQTPWSCQGQRGWKEGCLQAWRWAGSEPVEGQRALCPQGLRHWQPGVAGESGILAEVEVSRLASCGVSFLEASLPAHCCSVLQLRPGVCWMSAAQGLEDGGDTAPTFVLIT
jgi:hypothetical protein